MSHTSTPHRTAQAEPCAGKLEPALVRAQAEPCAGKLEPAHDTHHGSATTEGVLGVKAGIQILRRPSSIHPGQTGERVGPLESRSTRGEVSPGPGTKPQAPGPGIKPQVASSSRSGDQTSGSRPGDQTSGSADQLGPTLTTATKVAPQRAPGCGLGLGYSRVACVPGTGVYPNPRYGLPGGMAGTPGYALGPVALQAQKTRNRSITPDS